MAAENGAGRTETDPPEKPREVTISSPHDGLFRVVFGDPVNAASLLRAVLPSDQAARLDLDNVTVEPNALRRRDGDGWLYPDLLVRIPGRGDPGDFALGQLEHRSSEDVSMPIRLLAYRGALSADWLRKHGKPPREPSVIQVLVAHDAGGRQPWKVSLQAADAIGLGDATKSRDWPWKTWQEPLLLDLEPTSIDELTGLVLNTQSRLCLVLLKIAPGNVAIARALLPWADDLREIGRSQPEIVREMLKYAWFVSKAPAEEIQAFVHQALPENEEEFVATAQAILAEGEAKGERHAIRLLTTARGLTLTDDQSARIDACQDVAVLRGWAEAAVTASTTDDIFG